MDFLKQVIAEAAELEHTKLYESVDADFEGTFDRCMELVVECEQDVTEDVLVDGVECVARDIAEDVERDGMALSLKESLDDKFLADVASIESLSEMSIVGVSDLINESFEEAVQRILKSDRKLRMTSKDGKTKYKTRRRAAEAAAAASMAAVFGKKGVSRKAAGGKRG